jgi:hypothetical protein
MSQIEGRRCTTAYISTDKDIWEYLGPRYSFIGFDESTSHSEYQIYSLPGSARWSKAAGPNCREQAAPMLPGLLASFAIRVPQRVLVGMVAETARDEFPTGRLASNGGTNTSSVWTTASVNRVQQHISTCAHRRVG